MGAGVVRERFERRVSWTPGAEGAPRAGVVLERWPDEGTMRRDYVRIGLVVGLSAK